MTKEMLTMTKEELIAAICTADELGKALEVSTKEVCETRDKLLLQADILEEDVRKGVATMESLALAIAEMKKLLEDKYGTFVM